MHCRQIRQPTAPRVRRSDERSPQTMTSSVAPSAGRPPASGADRSSPAALWWPSLQGGPIYNVVPRNARNPGKSRMSIIRPRHLRKRRQRSFSVAFDRAGSRSTSRAFRAIKNGSRPAQSASSTLIAVVRVNGPGVPSAADHRVRKRCAAEVLNKDANARRQSPPASDWSPWPRPGRRTAKAPVPW